VGCIQGLTTGKLGKDNIFVHSTGARVTGNFEQFYMALPGCMATLERRANDEYFLVNLTWDNTYTDANDALKKTGLYKAEKISGDWEVTQYVNGKTDVVNKEIRYVAVADSVHENAGEAVKSIAETISKVPGAPSGSHFDTMDIHYTHDKGRLGGLRYRQNARRPLQNRRVNGSAILLARSMIASKDKKMVWVSEMGGSAVLTQALKVVSDNKVQLKSHRAFFFEPTTSANAAVNAARDAGIAMGRDMVKTGFANWEGNRDQLAMIASRIRRDKGYHIGHGSADAAKLVGKAQGAATVVLTSLGYLGVSATMPAVPAITAIASVLGVAGSAIAGLKMGESLVASIAPHFYNRNIGKIK